MILDKVVNFKDFSRPNKEIKYFSKTLTEFKDFSRRLLKFKTFQDCTTVGNYCWFDSFSRCGVHRYCLARFNLVLPNILRQLVMVRTILKRS